MISKDREYRAFEFETKEMRAMGKPVVFNSPTVIAEIDGVQYFEIIDARAFNNTQMDDVVLNIDHQGKPAAKTRNGTLRIDIRSDGIYMDADLSKNATGRELHEDIKNGFYDRMSFAFTVKKDEFDKQTRTRKILEIDRLFDVSAVTFPAYEQTSIMARSYFDTEVEKERLEKREREMKKKRLELMLALTKGD